MHQKLDINTIGFIIATLVKPRIKKSLYILYIGQFELLLYIIYCNSYFSKVIMVDTHSLESWQNIIIFTRSCMITYGLL